MPNDETKARIRGEMRRRRKAVDAATRQSAAHAICAALLRRADVRRAVESAAPIAVYLAAPQEIDLTDFIAAVLRDGGKVVAPRWNGTSYDLAAITGLGAADLAIGPMNIREPKPDAVRCAPSSVGAWLIPGLAFTRGGERLGYGGGWYDRLLASVAANVPKIGVAYGFQVVADLPMEAHDVRLTDVVTAEGADDANG